MISARCKARASELAIDAPDADATCNELLHQRQKERLAESTQRRRSFEIERLIDNILIVLIKDNPETQRRVEPCTTLLDLGYLHREAI
ncbi:hypothetical protein [Bradyrhizobium sp. USDA 4451]